MAGLSPAFKQFLCGVELRSISVDLDDIPDVQLRPILQKMMAGDAWSTFSSDEKQHLSSALSIYECANVSMSINPVAGTAYTRPNAGQEINVALALLHGIVLSHRYEAYAQIGNGLNESSRMLEFIALGKSDNIGNNVLTPLCDIFFPTMAEVSFTRDDVRRMIVIQETPGISENDQSNLVRLVDGLVASLNEDKTDRISMSSFLQFCTGSAHAYCKIMFRGSKTERN